MRTGGPGGDSRAQAWRVHPIVAADFSPRRRELALQMGADHVVDPKREVAVRELARDGGVQRPVESADAGRRGLPGPAVRPAVIFECVGVPGVIDGIMSAARATRESWWWECA